MPRIIAGKARGTSLVTPAGSDTRPTADKTKEALFSILTPRMNNAHVLDLFAGTGQIGLEALSRGAASAVLVENNPLAVKTIKTNIEKTHFSTSARILAIDVIKALRLLASEGCVFDLIFLDPPYAVAQESLERLAPAITASLLRLGGLIILEHDSGKPAPINVTNLQLVRSCKYGAAMLSFYQHITEEKPKTVQIGE